ncbi:hypothetical protein J2X01_002897 [Arthrobacter ginsengisoli]|uniref:Uncharacterized protein n=1 Tax=Arthrobacter ginsengisoli TaxID=1356565 RepID=A0ABU1UEJ1_9MICC|nr:hypothetical protein [Arthrobacter ginsengisoli]MDR7083602.1 hypothetical protein [Arthrobacter ginsengisoli]
MVSVFPLGQERFPSPTVLHLAVSVEDNASLDPQRAVLVPIDVSGLERKDLISVERVGENLILRVAHHQEDADLGPLGNAARVATREVLGLQWLDEAAAFNVMVALDGSGSAVNLVRDGTVSALVQVLTGIAQVIAGGDQVRAAVVDGSVHPVPPHDLASLPAGVVAAHQALVPSSSFRSAFPRPENLSPAAGTIVYLLTDSLPADIQELEILGEPGEVRHIIAVTPEAAWQLLGGTSVSHTVVEPARSGANLESHLLGEPHVLRGLVRSLLQPCLSASSELLEGVTL